MDIHRCRFVPYQPQSINALDFSHTSHPKQNASADLRLALGRENGDIEIWNPLNGYWTQEKVLRGSRGRTVEQVAWTQDLDVDEDDKDNAIEEGAIRLFSSGGSPSITEWDLGTGAPKRHIEGNSGDIWCFAAQPQWSRNAQDASRVAASPSQLLAAGCSDGSIILFSTADDTLQYIRVLAPALEKKAKVISITWRDRNTVVAGYENSCIRVIDVSGRKTVRTMTLGKAADVSSCVVWAVKCLPDGTILSGDSSGELKIWDPKNYALVQRLKTHEADILDIATSSSGDMIFTAGIDRRTVTYQPITGHANSKKERWQQISHRRYHQHDVKALATFEGKDLNIIVSGGMDTVPMVLPLKNIDSEYHRSLSHLPQKPQLSCSADARLMLTWWGQDLFIFHLPRRASEAELIETVTSNDSNHKLLARLRLKDDENITSAQISSDGTMVTAATSAGVKLFQLRRRTEDGEIEIRTRPVDLPAGIRAFGALHVGFTPDSKWLYAVRASNIIALVKIIAGKSSKDKPDVHDRVIKLNRKARRGPASKLEAYMRSINSVAFSSDSRVLATGDLSGAVDIWILEGHEDLNDTLNGKSDDNDSDTSSNSSDSDSDDESDSTIIHGQKWIRNPAGSDLPRLDSAVLALSFKPQSQSSQLVQDAGVGLHPTRHTPHPVSHEHPSVHTELVAVTSSHSVIEFDIMSARLSEWSRRNPSSCLPSQFTQIKDRAMGTFWDCSTSSAGERQERLWLYGPSWLFMIDMSRDLSVDASQAKIGKLGNYDVREPLPSDTTTQMSEKNVASELRVRKRKRNTGAGDQIRIGEWQRASQTATKFEKGDIDMDTGLISPVSDNDLNDEDIEIGGSEALRRLRRGEDTSTVKPSPKSKSQSTTQVPAPERKGRSTTTTTTTKSSSSSSPPYFATFRYRAIFGVGILSPSLDPSTPSAEGHVDGLEIAIVERPLYDVELLPRFDGGQEWSS